MAPPGPKKTFFNFHSVINKYFPYHIWRHLSRHPSPFLCFHAIFGPLFSHFSPILAPSSAWGDNPLPSLVRYCQYLDYGLKHANRTINVVIVQFIVLRQPSTPLFTVFCCSVIKVWLSSNKDSFKFISRCIDYLTVNRHKKANFSSWCSLVRAFGVWQGLRKHAFIGPYNTRYCNGVKTILIFAVFEEWLHWLLQPCGNPGFWH